MLAIRVSRIDGCRSSTELTKASGKGASIPHEPDCMCQVQGGPIEVLNLGIIACQQIPAAADQEGCLHVTDPHADATAVM